MVSMVLLLMFTGVILIAGVDVGIVVNDQEIMIPIPQMQGVGKMMIYAGFICGCLWLLPPWVVARVIRWLKSRVTTIRYDSRIKK